MPFYVSTTTTGPAPGVGVLAGAAAFVPVAALGAAGFGAAGFDGGLACASTSADAVTSQTAIAALRAFVIIVVGSFGAPSLEPGARCWSLRFSDKVERSRNRRSEGTAAGTRSGPRSPDTG